MEGRSVSHYWEMLKRGAAVASALRSAEYFTYSILGLSLFGAVWALVNTYTAIVVAVLAFVVLVLWLGRSKYPEIQPAAPWRRYWPQGVLWSCDRLANVCRPLPSAKDFRVIGFRLTGFNRSVGKLELRDAKIVSLSTGKELVGEIYVEELLHKKSIEPPRPWAALEKTNPIPARTEFLLTFDLPEITTAPRFLDEFGGVALEWKANGVQKRKKFSFPFVKLAVESYSRKLVPPQEIEKPASRVTLK